jgi:hypothetical protein
MRLPVFHLEFEEIAAPVDAMGRGEAKARHALQGYVAAKGWGGRSFRG